MVYHPFSLGPQIRFFVWVTEVAFFLAGHLFFFDFPEIFIFRVGGWIGDL